jgi:TolB-like protein
MSRSVRTSAQARYRLDLGDERLWDGKCAVHLTDKTFRLLRFFVQNPNRLLTKQEITATLWRDLHVSDGLVKEYVHDLRAALDDDPRRPRFIETVRGRGYRYLGGISCLPAAGPAAAPATPATARSGPPRVVVLPWEHHGGVAARELFGRGFSAELTSVLAKNRDLAVIARSSTATLEGEAAKIARARQQLRADYVIEGEVFPQDDGLRFTLSAVNAYSESIVWSDSFSIQKDRLSGFDQNLVPRVALAIGAHSGPLMRDMIAAAQRRMPARLTAFEHYLLAQEAYLPHDHDGIHRAYDLLSRALKMDPRHSQSWLLMTYILEFLRDAAPQAEVQPFIEQRNEAIAKAAALDPLDGRVLIEHADLLYDTGETEASARGYAKAFEMNRGAVDVLTIVAKYLAGVTGAGDDARQALMTARDLNPVGDALLAMNELRTYYMLRDYDAALAAAEDCPDSAITAIFLALTCAEQGQHDRARQIVQRECRERPNFSAERCLGSHHYIRDPAMKARVAQTLKELETYIEEA